jgi:nicotinamide phosphoribosyltransferase
MNSILMTDFYKATHMMQYRDGITHFTSYLTPRGSRFDSINGMVVFGIANFVNEYLIKNFNENFFNLNSKTIEREIVDTLCNGLGYPTEMASYTVEKIMGLYKLGYLPIELNGLPEGTICPMGVPAIEIRSTHKDFAWVAQSIESLLSCEFWHPAVSATIGHEYAKIAKAAYKETVDNTISYRTAMCDFSMRGQESNASAVASGAAFLASFNNCSTIQSREYVRENYCDEKPVIMGGLTSTEHSVMCSDFAICGDERETYRRLLTEVYPNTSFAAVCDSHDFWNIVTNILPSLRDEIEAHNGFLGVRHDSDEPVHALCGIQRIEINDHGYRIGLEDDADFEDFIYDFVNDNWPKWEIKPFEVYFHYYQRPAEERYDGKVFEGVYRIIPIEFEFGRGFEVVKLRDTMTWEDKGMVQALYELFGGHINEKGYKVINPKIKAVYGDSITIPRAKEIYRRLKSNGFAANNVSLGVGSFSMQCLEENGVLKPFTRDSFSIAVKATYCTYVNENGEEVEIPIFKNPKGCEGKKSLKGLCRVVEDNGNIDVIQELDKVGYDNLKNKNLMVNYFINGVGTSYSFNDIRERLEENIND